MSKLTSKRCVPCEGGVPTLDATSAQTLLAELDEGWGIANDGKEIRKNFQFKGYYKTIAFVNALAWIANSEGHHPDLEVSYNQCLVRYTTHAVNGLTENDFICAAKIDQLVASN